MYIMTSSDTKNTLLSWGVQLVISSIHEKNNAPQSIYLIRLFTNFYPIINHYHNHIFYLSAIAPSGNYPTEFPS